MRVSISAKPLWLRVLYIPPSFHWELGTEGQQDLYLISLQAGSILLKHFYHIVYSPSHLLCLQVMLLTSKAKGIFLKARSEIIVSIFSIYSFVMSLMLDM